MLVLTRKPGEKAVIGGGITVTVLDVIGGRIRLGIDAPDDVRILRGELASWMEPDAGQPEPDAVVRPK
jgi:carbon storage regulator